MKNVGLLIARIASGSLMAGHGAQKLFGWFEGPGFKQWNTITETRMGMKPGLFWGTTQAAAEFGGGALMALGLLNPLGPITVIASMVAAAYKGHWGKPIWSAKGGPELSVSFLATAVVAATQPPGRYSLDSMLGLRVPRWVTALSLLVSTAMLAETIRPTVTPRLLGSRAASHPEQSSEQ
jgi:putative oxidoreductase